MTKEEKDDLLRQLGYLMRFANRICNNYPEILVNDTVKVAIEKSKQIIKKHSSLDAKIVKS